MTDNTAIVAAVLDSCRVVAVSTSVVVVVTTLHKLFVVTVPCRLVFVNMISLNLKVCCYLMKIDLCFSMKN